MAETVRLTVAEAVALARDACRRAGAGEEAACSLARAAVDAEAAGQPDVGLAHLVDHLDALAAGRIRGDAVPVLSRPAKAVIASDAGGGIAQLGFDMAFDALVAAARTYGIALFSQANAYTCGALGWFAARPIPPGWALDADGNPTTDAGRAVKGALLAFGGPRGANIALMVEVLAAGLTGAKWSLDAPSFTSGSESLGSGLLVVAIAPQVLAPDFEARLAAQLDRLEHDFGVYVPGKAKADAGARAAREGVVVETALVARLRQ